MKYTGVVKLIPVYAIDQFGNKGFLGNSVDGKFRDTDGKEQWLGSRVLTK